MRRERSSSRKSRTVTWDTVRELALALPGAEESTSYGTPAFKVRGKLITRLLPEGDAIVVPIAMAERALRLQADPKTFYITDHYRPYPYMLVRLARVHRDDLAYLLEEAWRSRAPMRLLAQYDRK